MKKIIILLLIIGTPLFGQLSKVPMGVGTKLNVAFPIINTAIDQVNINTANILLKAPINNATLTGLTVFDQIKVSAGGATITAITTDGSNIHFWSGLTELTVTPGIGGATWGSITGSITAQNDLVSALALKAPVNNPTFTGTISGITAAMTGSMSTTHAANAVTSAYITNWNSAYGWGNHASIGYALNSSLSGYVPTTRTVNGHALSYDLSVTLSDLGVTAAAADINYTADATSNIQDQLNALYDSIRVLRALNNISETPYTSRVYYVSTSGSDSNDGKDSTHAWATLAHAEATAISPGDTIALKKGDTWSPATTVAIKHGGATGYNITWLGNYWGTGANAKIQVSANREDGNISAVHFITAGCHDVTFKNIIVDGNNKQCFGIVIGYHSAISGNAQSNEHNITIDGCSVLNVGDGTQYNIGFLCSTWNTDIYDITVQNCTFDGSDDEQLSFYAGITGEWNATPHETRNVIIKNNILTNWGRRGETTGYGLQINNKITGVLIEGNTLTQGASGKGNGIQVESNESTSGYFPTNVIIRYNKVTVTRSNEWAMLIQKGRAMTISTYYNVFVQGNNLTDTDGGCVWIVTATDPYTGAVINFWNNTLYSTSGRTVQNDCATVGAVIMRNNIMYNTGTDDASAQWCFNNNTANATAHSNNAFYRSANAGYLKVINNSYYFTNAEVATYEPTSITANPLFTTAGTDFTLQSGSPCINKGVDVGLTRDFAGTTISGLPDIGAYER